jgi:hypothetical protein
MNVIQGLRVWLENATQNDGEDEEENDVEEDKDGKKGESLSMHP